MLAACQVIERGQDWWYHKVTTRHKIGHHEICADPGKEARHVEHNKRRYPEHLMQDEDAYDHTHKACLHTRDEYAPVVGFEAISPGISINMNEQHSKLFTVMLILNTLQHVCNATPITTR